MRKFFIFILVIFSSCHNAQYPRVFKERFIHHVEHVQISDVVYGTGPELKKKLTSYLEEFPEVSRNLMFVLLWPKVIVGGRYVTGSRDGYLIQLSLEDEAGNLRTVDEICRSFVHEMGHILFDQLDWHQQQEWEKLIKFHKLSISSSEYFSIRFTNFVFTPMWLSRFYSKEYFLLLNRSPND